MCPAEGSSPGGGGGSEGSGDIGGGGPDVGAILAYLHHVTFGVDGDNTGNAGTYGGDNIGPPGSKEPEKYETLSRDLLDVLMAREDQAPGWPQRTGIPSGRSREFEPYGGITQPLTGNLSPFAGMDVDAYSGLPLGYESPDPFTGLPTADPFAEDERPVRARSGGPLAAIRQPSLLSSPYLLASNDVIACAPDRTSCMPPPGMSDANQSSLANLIQAEADASYVAAQAGPEGTAKVIGNTEVDMQNVAARAAQTALNDEYKRDFTVTQLLDHPIEIRHSAVLTGLGRMGRGIFTTLVSGGIIAESGGLAAPLLGATGLATGVADASSGFALAISGADSMETVRMTGQLDYVFALTSSPTSLMFGTTGLLLSGGDVDVSHGYALAGGVVGDLMTFRGDPSKLYSAVVPGGGTKAEKGASALLIKDVTALGNRARPESLEQVAAELSRDVTVRNPNAITVSPQELGGRVDLALPRMSDRAIAQHHLYNVTAKNMLEEVPYLGMQWRRELGKLNEAGLATSLEASPGSRGLYVGISRPGKSVPDLLHIGEGTGRPFLEVTTMNPATIASHEIRWYWPYSDPLLYQTAPPGWNIWLSPGGFRLRAWNASRP